MATTVVVQPRVVTVTREPRVVTVVQGTGTGFPPDGLSFVSSDDTTRDFLETKIVAGTGIGLTTLNPGGNETLEISSTGVAADEQVKVTTNDTTTSFLDDAIDPGTGLTRTILNPGADESLQLNVAANADGSILANANDIQVGVLATDAQHGVRGGGTQHPDATGATSGFMGSTDKTRHDAHLNPIDTANPHSVTAAQVGSPPNARNLTAGAGLTGGGDLSADRTFDVVANADGSIVANANDIQVGVIDGTQHGNLAGGALHAPASASGDGFLPQSNFAASTDPAVTDDSASGYAIGSLWVNGTDDTFWTCLDASVGAAVWRAQVHGPATAVDNRISRFDGTTGQQVQSSNVTLTDAGDLNPIADASQDMGTSALRWQEMRAERGAFAIGNGTIAFDQSYSSQGGIISGRANGSGSTLQLGGTFAPLILAGSASSGGTSTARVYNQGGGGSVFGAAFTSGAGTKTSEVVLGYFGYGGFCGGYANNNGAGTASIYNYSPGTFMWGYVFKSGAAVVTSQIYSGGTSYGAVVIGRLTGNAAHRLQAIGDSPGCLVQGVIQSNTASTIQANGAPGGRAGGRSRGGGTISTEAPGAEAWGNIQGTGNITASGFGSSAGGSTTSGTISATATGSRAFGNAITGTISATALGAIQFGVGTNAQANSLAVGDMAVTTTGGLRLIDGGAPGTPVNGDLWKNTHVYVRSNGQSVQLQIPQTWTTGTYATRRSFAGLTPTLAEVLELLETLVEDLQSGNHLL